MEKLPEVIRLQDVRGPRPEDAVGVGTFWYDPAIWLLPLSPAARVLYAGLCSYLGHHEINRKDLRNTLRSFPDVEISEALEELVDHGLLVPDDHDSPGSYKVRPVGNSKV